MTREEAIAEMEAYIPRASDGTRIRTDSLALAIDRWITAFREPGEPEKDLPDCEGWWLRGVQLWSVSESDKGDGLIARFVDAPIRSFGPINIVIQLSRGGWVKVVPRTSPPPSQPRFAPDLCEVEKELAVKSSPQADGGPGGEERCTACRRELSFSCRQIGTGLCHKCAHQKYAASLTSRPVEIALESAFHCGVSDLSQMDAQDANTSWGACDPQQPGVAHSLCIGINTTGAYGLKNGQPVLVRKYLPQACEYARLEFLRVGLSIRVVIAEGDPGPCNALYKFETPPNPKEAGSSTIYPLGQSCHQSGGYFNPKFTPQEFQIAMFQRMLLHEWGHLCGLRHSKGGIMDRALPNTTVAPTWKGDVSEGILLGWFKH